MGDCCKSQFRVFNTRTQCDELKDVDAGREGRMLVVPPEAMWQQAVSKPGSCCSLKPRADASCWIRAAWLTAPALCAMSSKGQAFRSRMPA